MLLTSYNNGIFALDSGYLRPQMASIHLIQSGDSVAVVDTGTNYSTPRVLGALAELGAGPDQVQYIILTHVHLDHAGGAGSLMQACPNAQLVVHPRGARHMIDPGKLSAATAAVYGEALARSMYGDLIPVEASRVIQVEHQQSLELGQSRTLTFYHTPGHAEHHVCIHDVDTGDVFTGDTLGISYREMDSATSTFSFASTTPSQFNPDSLKRSIELVAGLEPPALYLTHYSRVTDVPRIADQLFASIDAHIQVAHQADGEGQQKVENIYQALVAHFYQLAEQQGWGLQGPALKTIIDGDLRLNAQGVAIWLQRQQQA